MNFVLIVSIVCGLCVSLSMGKATPGKVMWFPNEDGTGMVPGILNDDFDFDNINSDRANPNNIHFYLWTHDSESRQEIENSTASLDSSKWDREAPVKVVVHGFSSTSIGGASGDIKNGYIQDGYPTNVNVVMVDWGWLAAAPWYDVAAAGTKTVGVKLAYFLDFIVKNGYTTAEKIHIVGHSLGAHAAGYAGKTLFELSGSKPGRISGLDPALPRFGSAKDENRIDPTDADYVDVIHSNAGTLLTGDLAFREPRGHSDFYPNKGSSQPGCGGSLELIAVCSHMRAATYFRESINSQGFRSCKCDDDNYSGFNQFKTCDCAKGEALMGEHTQPGTTGIYFLTTKKGSPFAQG